MVEGTLGDDMVGGGFFNSGDRRVFSFGVAAFAGTAGRFFQRGTYLGDGLSWRVNFPRGTGQRNILGGGATTNFRRGTCALVTNFWLNLRTMARAPSQVPLHVTMFESSYKNPLSANWFYCICTFERCQQPAHSPSHTLTHQSSNPRTAPLRASPTSKKSYITLSHAPRSASPTSRKNHTHIETRISEEKVPGDIKLMTPRTVHD